jgi:hypothetical protein
MVYVDFLIKHFSIKWNVPFLRDPIFYNIKRKIEIKKC